MVELSQRIEDTKSWGLSSSMLSERFIKQLKTWSVENSKGRRVKTLTKPFISEDHVEYTTTQKLKVIYWRLEGSTSQNHKLLSYNHFEYMKTRRHQSLMWKPKVSHYIWRLRLKSFKALKLRSYPLRRKVSSEKYQLYL